MKMQPALERQAFPVPEVARALSVSASTVWRMVKRGEVQVIRLGKRILVPKPEIERLTTPIVPRGAVAEPHPKQKQYAEALGGCQVQISRDGLES